MTTNITTDCDHKAIRYPDFLPTKGKKKTCRTCGAVYKRPEWMDRFSDAELRDIQGWFELLALAADCTLDPSHPNHISHREGAQRHKTLVVMHQFEEREKQVGGTIRRLIKICREREDISRAA